MKLKHWRRLFKVIGILFLFFIILFVVAFILVQQPKVQTYISNIVIERIQGDNETEASIESVHLKFPKSLVIDGFYQGDLNGDTLVYADQLTANFSLLKPFKKQIHLSKLKLDGAKINLSREDDDFNFAFLLNQKKPKVDKIKTPLDFTVNTIELNNTEFQLYDEGKIAIPTANLNQLKIDVKELDLTNKTITVGNILIDQPQIVYQVLGKTESQFELKALIPDLGWNIKTDDIKINDGQFQLKNEFAKPSELPINLADLAIQNIQTNIQNITFDSSLNFDIKNIAFTDNHHINVKKLEGKFEITKNTASINKIKLALNNSNLATTSKIIVYNFDDLVHKSYQNSAIAAYVTPSDANLFLPEDKQIKKPISLKLRSSGTLKNLSITALDLKSDELRLIANGNVRNLSNPKAAQFDISFDELTGSANSISKIVPWLTIPEQVIALGKVSGNGTLSGQSDDLIADLNIESDAGNVTTNIRINTQSDDLVYNGDITVPYIDLQKIMPSAPSLGRAGGTFRIDGSGTSIETLNGKVKGKLFNIELEGYTYSDLYFDGNIKDQVFNGNIKIDDENVALDFDGMLDLSDSIPSINSKINLEKIDLKALNLFDRPLTIGMSGNVQLTGNSFYNPNGEFNLATLHIENERGELDLDSTLFTFKSVDDLKSYAILNDKLVAHAEGNFDPIKWPGELKRYLSNYIYYLNDTDTSEITEQQIKGDIVIKEGFGVIDFFIGNVSLPDNLEATFEFHNTEDIFNVNAYSNLVGYNNYEAQFFNLEASTKDGELLTKTGIDMLSAEKPKIDINHIYLESINTKNSIDGRFTVESEASANSFDLKPSIQFLNDSINIHFSESYFKLNNVLWPFKNDNNITLKKDAIIANDFAIFNDNQYLQIVNATSDLSETLVEFNMLSIPSLVNIIELDTVIKNGFLTGQVKLKDPLKDLTADVDLNFNAIQVFDYYCDSITIDASYKKSDNKINIAAVFDDPNYDLTAVGFYDLNKGVNSPANLDIDVDKLHLSFLDKILKDEAHFDVLAEGQLQFRGSATQPILLGEASILDTAKIHINFLGIDLLVMPENGIQEKVVFTENTMDFQSMNVRDPFGNRAYMEGKLTHFNFKDVSVDAKLITDNFNLLNTTYDQNEEFFGRAFGEGIVKFSGLTRNINMDIDMKTKEFTKLSIPVASAGDTKDYNFRFINPNDSSDNEIRLDDLIEIKGVNMDFDLEVTPEAELELVLNTESDNNLKARGRGDLNLKIDQNKQLSIYGTYNLESGDYVFSPQNLLNKEFEIKNGSSIEWNGKPFEAGLDVEAVYHVKARIDNILEDSTRASSTAPMDVIIKIGGTLDETDVSFGIEPSRTGIASALDEVESFLDEIKNDEGEITTQAISLLLVGRFLPSNSTVFTGTNFSASEFGKTTALELVSNQVSNYLTDAISKLITEVELSFNIIQREDFSTEEPGQTTTVQLDYTQKFVNNRLIINVGGNFEFQDQQSSQSNTIAGDFEVEGVLTEDGRLRGKAFHRTADYDIFNQDRSKTGVSIAYQKDFDTIDEVFRPDPNRKKKRQNKRNTKREDKKELKEQRSAKAIREKKVDK